MKRIIVFILTFMLVSTVYADKKYNEKGIKNIEKKIAEKIEYRYQSLELQSDISIYPENNELYIKINIHRKNIEKIENIGPFSLELISYVKNELEKYNFQPKLLNIKVREYSKFRKGKIILLESYKY